MVLHLGSQARKLQPQCWKKTFYADHNGRTRVSLENILGPTDPLGYSGILESLCCLPPSPPSNPPTAHFKTLSIIRKQQPPPKFGCLQLKMQYSRNKYWVGKKGRFIQDVGNLGRWWTNVQRPSRSSEPSRRVLKVAKVRGRSRELRERSVLL